MGNTGNKHTCTLLECCALMLARRKEQRNLARAALMGNSATPDKTNDDAEGIAVDYIFCEVFLFAIETNLWGPGEPRHCAKRSNSEKQGEGDRRMLNFMRCYDGENKEFTTLCDHEKHINKNMLRIFSTGDSFMKDYFNVFMKNGALDDPHHSEDPEQGGVSLKAVKPLAEDAKEDSRMKIVRATSLEYEIIKKQYLADELKCELEYLNSLVATEREQPVVRTKEENIHKVIVLRMFIMNINQNWERDRRSEIEIEVALSTAEDDASINEIMENELQNEFFTLGSYSSPKANESFNFRASKYRIDSTDINADVLDSDSAASDVDGIDANDDDQPFSGRESILSTLDSLNNLWL